VCHFFKPDLLVLYRSKIRTLGFLFMYLAICESDTCASDEQCIILDSPDPATGNWFECIGQSWKCCHFFKPHWLVIYRFQIRISSFFSMYLAICESDTCAGDEQCIILNSPDPLTGNWFECIGRLQERDVM